MTAPKTERWSLRSMAATVAVAVTVLVAFAAPAPAVASQPDLPNASLARGAGFDRPNGSAQVRALQRHLRALGARPGPVDGRFGPLTESAVQRFQRARGLVADGIAGPATRAALHGRISLARGAGGDRRHGSHQVRALQRKLRTVGADPGRIDGRFGPLTEAAVRRFQRDGGLEADGIVGPRTQQRLARATATRAPEQRANQRPPAQRSPRVAALGADTRAKPVDGPAVVGVVFVVLAVIGAGLFLGNRWRRRGRASPSGATPNARPPSARPVRQPTPTPPPRGATALPVPHPSPAPPQKGANAPPVPHPSPAPPQKGANAPPVPHPSTAPPQKGANAPPVPQRTSAPPQKSANAPPVQQRTSAPPRKGATAPTASTPQNGSAAPEFPVQSTVRALGYVSVPADSPLEAGAGAQARAIEAACAARRWTFVGGVREHEPTNGKGLQRPGLTHALGRLQRDEADCLVVAELSRLTRSVVELADLLAWLEHAGRRLVVLDVAIDTATEAGRLALNAVSTVSGMEHVQLAERTRKGLAAARAKGAGRRPAVSDRPELVKQITAMRAQGMTLQAIADALNANGEPTLRGGVRWRPSSVQAALGYKRPPAARTPESTREPSGEEAERWAPWEDASSAERGSAGVSARPTERRG